MAAATIDVGLSKVPSIIAAATAYKRYGTVSTTTPGRVPVVPIFRQFKPDNTLIPTLPEPELSITAPRSVKPPFCEL